MYDGTCQQAYCNFATAVSGASSDVLMDNLGGWVEVSDGDPYDFLCEFPCNTDSDCASPLLCISSGRCTGPLDECAADCDTCEKDACTSAGQLCFDPVTTSESVGDWMCTCPMNRTLTDDMTVADGTYRIESNFSSKMLRIRDADINDGGRVVVYEDTDCDCQLWRVVHERHGWYRFMNLHSGKALSMKHASHYNGAAAVQLTYVGEDHQLFRIWEQEPGWFTILNKRSEKCLLVSDSNMGNDAEIIQYSYRPLESVQNWRFTLAEASKNDIVTAVGVAVANCSVDECANSMRNATCTQAGQFCIDPDLYKFGDWGCSCYHPLVGFGSGRVAEECAFDECEADCATCEDDLCLTAGQLCYDPVTTLENVSDWMCTCERHWQTDEMEIADGTYTIESEFSERLLRIRDADLDDGACVVTYEDTGCDCQLWRVIHEANGYYRVINVPSGKAWSIEDADMNNDARTIQLPWSGEDYQLWDFQPQEPGWYTILNKNSQRALTVSEGNKGNDAEIRQYHHVPVNSVQNWKFTLMEARKNDIPTEVGGIVPDCSVDECENPKRNATCAVGGQICTDPDLYKFGDWGCSCVPPLTGFARGRIADECAADECEADCATCEKDVCSSAGQLCLDPVTVSETVGDWMCVCPMNQTQTDDMTIAEGVYYIESKYSAKLLDVREPSLDDDSFVVVNGYDESDTSQLWRVMHEADGYYRFLNLNSGKALSVSQERTDYGAPLIQYTWLGKDHQLFEIKEVETGWYMIINQKSDMGIDVWNWNAGSDASIKQHVQSPGNSVQNWKFTLAPPTKSGIPVATGGAVANCSVDECADPMRNTTCSQAGQFCIDPDLYKFGDWGCSCVHPTFGDIVKGRTAACLHTAAPPTMAPSTAAPRTSAPPTVAPFTSVPSVFSRYSFNNGAMVDEGSAGNDNPNVFTPDSDTICGGSLPVGEKQVHSFGLNDVPLGSNPWTMSIYAKCKLAGLKRMLIHMGGEKANGIGIGIQFVGGSDLTLFVDTFNRSDGHEALITSAVVDFEWHHYAATYDGTTLIVTAYISTATTYISTAYSSTAYFGTAYISTIYSSTSYISTAYSSTCYISTAYISTAYSSTAYFGTAYISTIYSSTSYISTAYSSTCYISTAYSSTAYFGTAYISTIYSSTSYISTAYSSTCYISTAYSSTAYSSTGYISTAYSSTAYFGTAYISTIYSSTSYISTAYSSTCYISTACFGTAYISTIYSSTSYISTAYSSTCYNSTSYIGTAHTGTTYISTAYDSTTHSSTTYFSTAYNSTFYFSTSYSSTTYAYNITIYSTSYINITYNNTACINTTYISAAYSSTRYISSTNYSITYTNATYIITAYFGATYCSTTYFSTTYTNATCVNTSYIITTYFGTTYTNATYIITTDFSTTYTNATCINTSYISTTYFGTTYTNATYIITTYFSTTYCSTTYFSTTYTNATCINTSYISTTYFGTTYTNATYIITTYFSTTYCSTTDTNATYIITTYFSTTYFGTTYTNATYIITTDISTTDFSTTYTNATCINTSYISTTYFGTTYTNATYIITTYFSTTYCSTTDTNATYIITTYFSTIYFGTTYTNATYIITTDISTTYFSTTYTNATYIITTNISTTDFSTTYTNATYIITTCVRSTYVATRVLICTSTVNPDTKSSQCRADNIGSSIICTYAHTSNHRTVADDTIS
ncbi:hypothetical protein DIPPA_31854 [Diplonema papillatum]|nr:hypothetical protein DIPPA_31854 [Diplonema papillatum]